MQDLIQECIGFRLGSAYRRVDRLLNRAFAQIDLNHAHSHILTCLLGGGEMRLVDISRVTGFEASTVSRLVKELARRKLVRRRKDPHDGRAQLLRPGARAEALRDEIEQILRRADEKLRREMPHADLSGLMNAVDIMDQLP